MTDKKQEPIDFSQFPPDTVTLSLDMQKSIRKVTALREASENNDMELDMRIVALACEMCEAMGLDPNDTVVAGDPTKNWQFLMPAAAVAYGRMDREATLNNLIENLPEED